MFETLFSLPQGERFSGNGGGSLNTEDFKDNLQVVQTVHDGAMFEDLLRFYYPPPPKLGALNNVINLLHAANYYQIDEIVSHLRGLVLSPCFLEKHPMRVYAIAWRCGWKDVVKKAALQMLQKELTIRTLPVSGCPEMDEVPAGALLRLFEYHRACGEAARSAVDWSVVKWKSKSRNATGSICECPEYSAKIFKSSVVPPITKKWWYDYLDEVRTQLRKTPCRDTILSRTYPSLVLAEKCESCSSNYVETGVYCNMLVGAVEKAIREVSQLVYAKPSQ